MMQYGVVADGYGRAWQAQASVVSREVRAEYREVWQQAGFWQRIVLLWQIRRETLRRINLKAPADGLY